MTLWQRGRVGGNVDGFFPALLLYASVPAGAGVMLVLAWNHLRIREQRGATRYLVGGLALVVLAAGILIEYDVREHTTRFQYIITLAPNGTGIVRVSIPAPVDDVLAGTLIVSPSSSSAAMNRTGNEPAIDITLRGETTVIASASAYRYFGPADLTRADSWEVCNSYPSTGCGANVSLLVISGTIAAVHIAARASWSRPCYWPTWEFDAVALPGEREYPATFSLGVC